MTQPRTTRSIIDTHRHIFGPKLLQKFVENIGFDDSKPLPQANAGEMFFYRESVDVDYSMEIQRQSGVSSCVNSYGGEVETFAQHIIKANTIDRELTRVLLHRTRANTVALTGCCLRATCVAVARSRAPRQVFSP